VLKFREVVNNPVVESKEKRKCFKALLKGFVILFVEIAVKLNRLRGKLLREEGADTTQSQLQMA